jgi:hypothetical protein
MNAKTRAPGSISEVFTPYPIKPMIQLGGRDWNHTSDGDIGVIGHVILEISFIFAVMEAW